MANNQSDLRSLYNQSKIFLDDFAGLISFILGMEAAGIKVCTRSGGFSFGTLYFSLLNYKGDDQMMLMFRDHCLNRLKAAQVFISDYRNQYVQHLSTESNKETIWTLHDMRGDFRFLGKRPSLPPKEIVFVVKGLVECSKKFVVDHL